MARIDARVYQIAVLGSLLGYGLVALEFEVSVGRAALILGCALVTQYVCTRLWRLPAFDPRSALISGLSLCLMLRTNHPGLALLAAIITIASKFVIRIRGTHVFNPTNFGIVALVAQSALAQSPSPPSPPLEASSEVGNFGSIPFAAPEQLLLRPDQKASLRMLEDQHIREARDLEDKYDGELRAMRVRQAQEREQMIRSFKR